MQELLKSLDWVEVITTIWTVILVPILSYLATQLNEWAKAKKIDRYTTLLQKNVISAVKDVYQTVVNELKNTTAWNAETQKNVKELAKQKAIATLTNTAYQCLKQANDDFDQYIDVLIESAVFDIKNGK